MERQRLIQAFDKAGSLMFSRVVTWRTTLGTSGPITAIEPSGQQFNLIHFFEDKMEQPITIPGPPKLSPVWELAARVFTSDGTSSAQHLLQTMIRDVGNREIEANELGLHVIRDSHGMDFPEAVMVKVMITDYSPFKL